MKKIIPILCLLILSNFSSAQIIDIPDTEFKNKLVNLNVASHQSSYVYGQNYSVSSNVDLNGDGEIQISEAESVYGLHLGGWDVSSLSGIEYFTNLEYLDFRNNDVTSVDLSNNVNLKYLSCDSNNLNSIDLSNNLLLDNLNISGNNISSVDISMLINLKNIKFESNSLTSLNIDNNTNLEIVACHNNSLTDLNVTNNSNLRLLSCQNNQLTTLDLSQNINLEWFRCNENQLTSLDLSTNSNLRNFSCEGNQFTNLDLSNCVSLEYLNVAVNELQELDLNNNLSLEYLAINYNNISNIDLSNLINLEDLYVHHNLLTTLDISNNPNIDTFTFDNNPLVYINIKDGVTRSNYFSFSMPTLEYICVDDNEFNQIQSLLNNPNVVINSYCSFEPGGEFYSIEGQNTSDVDNDGCDVDDFLYPNLKFKINAGVNDGTYISDASGNYNIDVEEGSHVIEPVLENLDYYSVTPNSLSVNFPSETSPYIQDFCIEPNGAYNDLEVFIVPITAAIPGFNSEYKIIYKNKGTTTLSGTVGLDFEDDYMNYLSAMPMEDIQSTGNLQWNYTDLQPFEIREIDVIFNLNTPTNLNFPLNGDDQLDFGGTIESGVADETPDDNIFSLKQIVVNSYDPNDKTCLEGSTITPELVGKYVHYLIRFENLGTANAINVVVKDMIDVNKFDISSLVPLDASHDFKTSITQTNRVEFIFENINLPFDDANNDGYVVFKIKTLESLQLGDTFENEAEIYFDFNFPIITNNYSTLVQDNLSVEDFDNLEVSLFPNPAEQFFTISTDVNIDLVKILDINGRLISTIKINDQEFQKAINIEALTTGIYFVEIQSGTNKKTLKLLKR